MYTRLAAMTAAAILIATPAFAAKLPETVQNMDQCRQLIDVTNQTVTEQSDIGEKARNQVAALLKQVEEQCNASQFDDAEKTAAQIRGLVATE